jgi:hypothetical protein
MDKHVMRRNETAAELHELRRIRSVLAKLNMEPRQLLPYLRCLHASQATLRKLLHERTDMCHEALAELKRADALIQRSTRLAEWFAEDAKCARRMLNLPPPQLWERGSVQ